MLPFVNCSVTLAWQIMQLVKWAIIVNKCINYEWKMIWYLMFVVRGKNIKCKPKSTFVFVVIYLWNFLKGTCTFNQPRLLIVNIHIRLRCIAYLQFTAQCFYNNSWFHNQVRQNKVERCNTAYWVHLHVSMVLCHRVLVNCCVVYISSSFSYHMVKTTRAYNGSKTSGANVSSDSLTFYLRTTERVSVHTEINWFTTRHD